MSEVDREQRTSWSEIDTIRHCLHKHYLKYKEGWVEKVSHPAAALGTNWHTLMEVLYVSKDPDLPCQLLAEWESENPGAEWVATLQWMLEGYYEKWGYGDPVWVNATRFIELEFLLLLPDVGFGDLWLKGFIDLGIEWNDNGLWVVDHKSAQRPPQKRDLELADQWTLYVWALRQLGYKVVGSFHNYARTEKLVRKMSLDERFSRIPIDRTDREVEAVVREATIQAHLGKMDNGAPRSPGEMCFRRCGFSEVCIADRKYGPTLATNILQITNKKRDDE